MGKLMPPVDIRDVSNMNELTKRMSIGPVLVFVYADWCGHCTNYKPKMEELEREAGRTVQTARIQDTVFPQSPLADAKIEGYPTLMLVENGKPVKFKNSQGEVTNAIPNHTDMNQMKLLVRNAGTPKGEALLNDPVSNNKVLTMNSATDVQEEVVQPSKNLVKNSAMASLPPNILADSLPTEQVESLNKQINAKFNSGTVKSQANQQYSIHKNNNPKATALQTGGGRQTGGGLWYHLMLASNKVAPAAALFLGAVAATSRHSRTRKHKGSSSKRTRRDRCS